MTVGALLIAILALEHSVAGITLEIMRAVASQIRNKYLKEYAESKILFEQNAQCRGKTFEKAVGLRLDLHRIIKLWRDCVEELKLNEFCNMNNDSSLEIPLFCEACSSESPENGECENRSSSILTCRFSDTTKECERDTSIGWCATKFVEGKFDVPVVQKTCYPCVDEDKCKNYSDVCQWQVQRITIDHEYMKKKPRALSVFIRVVLRPTGRSRRY